MARKKYIELTISSPRRTGVTFKPVQSGTYRIYPSVLRVLRANVFGIFQEASVRDSLGVIRIALSQGLLKVTRSDDA